MYVVWNVLPQKHPEKVLKRKEDEPTFLRNKKPGESK